MQADTASRCAFARLLGSRGGHPLSAGAVHRAAADLGGRFLACAVGIRPARAPHAPQGGPVGLGHRGVRDCRLCARSPVPTPILTVLLPHGLALLDRTYYPCILYGPAMCAGLRGWIAPSLALAFAVSLVAAWRYLRLPDSSFEPDLPGRSESPGGWRQGGAP